MNMLQLQYFKLNLFYLWIIMGARWRVAIAGIQKPQAQRIYKKIMNSPNL